MPADPAEGVAVAPRALLLLLAALVDKSLLRRRADTTTTTRYDLHELVRQYAAARLAEKPTEQASAAAQHAAFYANWVAQQETILKSARQKQAVHAIVAEIDNIRVAWRWGCEQHSASLLLQMFFTLDWFCEVHGWNVEGEALFAQGNTALCPIALCKERRMRCRYHDPAIGVMRRIRTAYRKPVVCHPGMGGLGM
jgi:hypothetical protein